jgi:hypothetical protein
MQLEALTSGCAEVALSVVTAQVIKETVEIWGELPGRLLETKHELEVLDLSLDLTVGLLVGTVVFEDLVGILGDSNLF